MALMRREIEEYFARYASLVYRRALVLMGTRADAEDAVQEVFVRAAANLETFRQESQVSTWLYRITTNYCLTQLRNRNRQGRLLTERYEYLVSFPGCLTPAEGLALRELLSMADPQEAHAAVYVHVDGMTRPEAAKALGVSLRTIGNLLNRFGEWARAELGRGDETLSKITAVAPVDETNSKNASRALPDSSEVGVNVTGGYDGNSG